MFKLLITFLCVSPLAGLLREGECLDATSSFDQVGLASSDQERTSGKQAVVNATLRNYSRARNLDEPVSLINLFGNAVGTSGKSTVLSQLIEPFSVKKKHVATTTTTSTTTEKPEPLHELGQNIQTFGNGLIEGHIKMINAPLKVINGIAKTGSGEIDKGKESGAHRGPLDESKYYEYTVPLEPFSYRRPKYFSRECQFRFACEVGKIAKPFTHQVSSLVETNKFIQDLQNRYTRAMSYGSLYGDCDRYYCVLVKLMGGPAGFASGVAEIVNAVLNKDDAEDSALPVFPGFTGI